MGAPAVGTVIDGYRFSGGDPNSEASWVQVGKAGDKYASVLASEQAKADMDRLTRASQGQRDAYGMEATALQAESLLPKAPVGAFANQAEWMGRHAPALGGLLGVPDRNGTAALESLGRLQSMGALGDSANLKGPMSDKDVAFLRGMQYDPTRPREYNDQVVASQKWAAQRQAAYGAALKSWTRTLGSPSSTNANGLDFDSWWGQYASQKLPPPGTTPVMRGQGAAPRPQAAPQAHGPQPVRVRSPQEARALKPGTPFITPDGRLKYR